MADRKNAKDRVSVEVVGDHKDMMAAMMIRSAVYVGEMGFTLEANEDGNDFTSTHLIAKVDGKPAGTMRLRYFRDIAVLERMAILKDYRLKRFGSRGVAWELGEAAFHFCRVKGYSKFYGKAKEGLVDFWKRFAPDGCEFVPIPDSTMYFEGVATYPMEGSAPPLANAINGYDRLELLTSREGDLPFDICRYPKLDATTGALSPTM